MSGLRLSRFGRRHEAMPEVSGRCPVCGAEMRVTRLRCVSCDSELAGSFTLGKFFHLRHPPARARLREVIRARAYEVGEEAPPQPPPLTPERRREILDALAQKRISAD